MLPKFLLLVAATARGAGVSIVVRNLAGEDVVVSWLQPGREPRGRVPQQEKPLKNATTMSINSYETHEFIVASVAPAAAARGRARGGRGRQLRVLGVPARGAAKAAAVAIAQGTAEAQKATRRRSLEKRNASCAAHAGNSETPAGHRAARPGATDRDLDDPIAGVKARSVGLANFLSNYSLGLDGQEELMAVQYNPGQQYMLHCDGSCDGSPFVAGGRLATVLMYCAAADGGGTAFPNANVHVVPAKGQAVYFHFRGPEPDGVVEDWHTEHAAAPRSGEVVAEPPPGRSMRESTFSSGYPGFDVDES
ncbi:procollagen-proline 4-dioxygenase [Aureococcus anophagefferens]|nr:procollagen-proline 4-dioxygenase [Aureococcus anophagefferens]